MDRGSAQRSPLDQLEAQVNLVLEHTGRLFANNARTHGQINNPLRLKQVIAGANNSFHDALDQLESELTLARAVMRRDLAVYRSQRGARSQPGATNLTQPQNEADNATANASDDDIVMGESSIAQDPTPQQESLAQPEELEGEKSASSLHLEIPGQDHQAAGHPGDENTGTYSNFDFESLFNDPSSAGATSRASPKNIPVPASPPKLEDDAAGSNPPATTEDAKSAGPRTMTITDEPLKPESFNTNNDDGFEFADLTSFGPDTDMQDTDGISSLLPGLESYANSGNDSQSQQPVSADFNIFDAAGAGDFGSVGTADQKLESKTQQNDQQQQQQQQPDMGNRDDTFEDIMNFTEFDMGDFSGAAEGEGGESKFDASFFDI